MNFFNARIVKKPMISERNVLGVAIHVIKTTCVKHVAIPMSASLDRSGIFASSQTLHG